MQLYTYTLISIITPALSRFPKSISHCINLATYIFVCLFFVPKILDWLIIMPLKNKQKTNNNKTTNSNKNKHGLLN